jgi:hypothetical protein
VRALKTLGVLATRLRHLWRTVHKSTGTHLTNTKGIKWMVLFLDIELPLADFLDYMLLPQKAVQVGRKKHYDS